VPVVYFTELLAIALGAAPEGAWLSRREADLVPLFISKGLTTGMLSAADGGEAS